MSTPEEPAPSVTSPRPLSIAIAWTVTLLVSSLGDIFCHELSGAAPLWLLWAKAGLLAALIGLTWLWRPLRALRPYFIVLLAIALLMRGSEWLWAARSVRGWWTRQSWTGRMLAFQLLEAAMALLLIALLFALRRRRQRFFLVRGERPAMIAPFRRLGEKAPSPLWRFGLIFTLVVIVVQVFMIVLPLAPTAAKLRLLWPLLPVILLLAAANGFTEEVILRAAPIAPLFEVVGKGNAIWMAAVLFGLSHYVGGLPSGIPGVLATTLLGWFFGKCMVDSKGFFWPWLFHAVLDVLPFAAMALAAMA